MNGLSFNGQTSSSTNRTLIPAGVRAFATLTVKGMKVGRESNARYAECELQINSPHPFERRKMFLNINDPSDPNAKEGAVKMSMGALSRMLEASGLVQVGNEASYAAVSNQDFETIMSWLDARTVGIQVRIEKGQGGYDDKNGVGEWLSPNPLSGGFKGWQKLLAGDLGVPPAPPTPGAPGGAPAAVVPAPAFAAHQAPAPAAAPAAPAAPAAMPPAGARPVSPAPAWLQNAQKSPAPLPPTAG
jgi:hypothetical protein